MPNRILKESICTSDTVDQLSWFQEVFFYRLIVCCDDYGRMDARPAILRARLFPLKSVTDKQMEDALNMLRTAGMVEVYTHDGKPYLQLRTWGKHQRLRNSKEKYPAPEDADSRGELPQMAASGGLTHAGAESQSESQSEYEYNPNICEDQTAAPRGSGDIFLERSFSAMMQDKLREWLKYKTERRESYKSVGLKSFLSEIESKLKQYNESDVIALISECMANNWKGIIWDKLKSRDLQLQRTGSKPMHFERPPEDYDKLAVDLFAD